MPLTTFYKRASRSYSAAPQLIYEILTDYDSYRDWMPHVSKSKLLAKELDLAIAELELGGPYHDTVSVECIHSKNKKVLSRVIRGHSGLSELEWTLAAAAGGKCEVALAVEWKRNWRWLVGGHRGLSPKSLLSHLESAVSMFQPESQAESGEQILDICETGEGLVCNLLGKRYILTPASEDSNG